MIGEMSRGPVEHVVDGRGSGKPQPGSCWKSLNCWRSTLGQRRVEMMRLARTVFLPSGLMPYVNFASPP